MIFFWFFAYVDFVICQIVRFVLISDWKLMTSKLAGKFKLSTIIPYRKCERSEFFLKTYFPHFREFPISNFVTFYKASEANCKNSEITKVQKSGQVSIIDVLPSLAFSKANYFRQKCYHEQRGSYLTKQCLERHELFEHARHLWRVFFWGGGLAPPRSPFVLQANRKAVLITIDVNCRFTSSFRTLIGLFFMNL